MLYGNWLVLPVLFPIFGGLMAARIHTLGARRTVVSTILILQILLVLPAAIYDTPPYTMLHLAPGLRIVLQGDALGRFFAALICIIWFAVAFFAYEYMNHEGHRERFFGCGFLLCLA